MTTNKKRDRLGGEEQGGGGGGGGGGVGGDGAVAPLPKKTTLDGGDDERNARKKTKRTSMTRREHVEAVVARANAVADLTALIAAAGSDLDLDLRGYVEASSLPQDVKRWVFDLTKRNMVTLYERTWGWNNYEKRRELAHSDARFLVMHDEAPTATATASPTGFVHFRFEVEKTGVGDGADEVGGVVPVVYVYELQTEPESQRRGIGRRLMRAVEVIGAELCMERCMLTVLKINEGAARFYDRLGYRVDADSPTDQVCHYTILTKHIVATPAKKAKLKPNVE